MSARPKLALDDQMTVEEFLAFTATRPDEERWELIEGAGLERIASRFSPTPAYPRAAVKPNATIIENASASRCGANHR